MEKKRRLTNEQKRIIEKRRRARRRKRNAFIALFCLIILAIVAAIGVGVYSIAQNKAEERAAKEAEIAAEEAALEANRAKIAEAAELAAVYDYDGAIDLLKSIDGYDDNGEVLDAIAEYTVIKTTLKAVDCTKVPHIFFHSLIVDTSRAFDEEKWGEAEVAGINAWMTTIEEFDRIMQQLYDNGYVLVRMRDLVTQVTTEDGSVVFKANPSLLLPEGKKASVLSIDDWSYYHSYTGKGYGDKAVVDEQGNVKVQYTDANGNVDIGDYDVVPRLNSFIETHPGFSYKGARGMIALTGYNGGFGYRTDEDYVNRQSLQRDQSEW
ncbi:MAG: polysaccharide deacetylase, partial [Lachnospiraceae bacterium]|nr:polysaccharide deacetylase [Candidatus Equihabitans merdae]